MVRRGSCHKFTPQPRRSARGRATRQGAPVEWPLTALSRHSRAAARGSQMRRFRPFVGLLSNREIRPQAALRNCASGWWGGYEADLRTGLLHMLITSSSQFVEQRFCLFEIGRAEAFGEPAIDRREQVARFGMAPLVAAQPGEARGGNSQSFAPCSSATLRALR
jgi:hypothetical protein